MWSSKLPPLRIQLAPLFISQWDALFPDDIAAGGKVAHARRVYGNHKRERERELLWFARLRKGTAGDAESASLPFAPL